MPLPLLAGGLVAGGSALSGIYRVGKALENRRYWDAYYRNTGYRPLYPFRAGYYDYINEFGRSLYSAGFAGGFMNLKNFDRRRR